MWQPVLLAMHSDREKTRRVVPVHRRGMFRRAWAVNAVRGQNKALVPVPHPDVMEHSRGVDGFRPGVKDRQGNSLHEQMEQGYPVDVRSAGHQYYKLARH